MNWIDVNVCHPPYNISIMLYVIEYKNIDLSQEEDRDICIGFYNEFYKKYYLVSPIHNSLGKEIFEIEDKLTKVVAWSTLPLIPKDIKRWLKRHYQF